MTSLDEAWGWLKHADETLRSAQDCLRIGHYGPAVSLAYFSAFYAAKAVIAFSKGRDPRTHRGVLVRFRQLAVLESDFPEQTAQLLSQLIEQRNKTDYDFTYRDMWKSENTAAIVHKGETFVNEVYAWVRKHAPSPDPQ